MYVCVCVCVRGEREGGVRKETEDGSTERMRTCIHAHVLVSMSTFVRLPGFSETERVIRPK